MATASAQAAIRPWLLPRLPGEGEAAHRDRKNRAYFDEQLGENDDWFRRLGFELDFRGKRVLDFGCGHGALALHAARAGAAEVVGLDLDDERIEFARRHIAEAYPAFAGTLGFACDDLARLPAGGGFDLVLTKDTLEHVDDVHGVLAQLARVLKPGGLLAAGFSPLYYSPFGHHGRFGTSLPWSQAVLPDRALLALANRRLGADARSVADVGLNKLTPRGLRAALADPPGAWRVLSLRYNQGDRRLMPAMRLLRRVPGLEKYFTAGVYLVAERLPAEGDA